MILQRFEVPGLAHYSYLLGSGGKAVVIDPERNVDIYIDFAHQRQLTITHVLETHIHADYASGALQLAETCGAALWLSAHDTGGQYQYAFPHHEFRDGDELECGDLRVVAMHTPGHTPEHLSFLLYEKTRCGQPVALFTGDFLFVGSLGRPDLLGEEEKNRLAADLYDSVHDRISRLPDGVEVYPAHGAGSLCGSGMAAREQSTLGYERFCNVFMSHQSKTEFVDTILGSVPEFPDYYRRMKVLNARGPRLLDRLPGGCELTPAAFRESLEREAAVVIDLRRPEAFGGAHIPGSFNIGAGQNLSLWAGWVVPADRPILLVGEGDSCLEDSRRALIRVGLDSVAGTLRGGIAAWLEAGFAQAHIPQISVQELARDIEESGGVFVLDVRSPGERAGGRIAGSVHIPGGTLAKRLHEVPVDRRVHVICGSGYRSGIAASILSQAGRRRVVNVVGGMTAWVARNLPVVG